MKKILQLSIIFLLILFGSCNNDEGTTEYEISRNQRFFDKNSNDIVSDKKNSIIDFLNNENQKSNFLDNLSDQTGLPIWENVKIYKGKAITGKSADPFQTIIVPLTENNKNLSSLLFVEDKLNENSHIYTIKNNELFEIVNNKQISIKSRENILMQFLYFDYLTFGKREYGNIPIDLFPNIKVRNDKKFKQFRISISDNALSVSPTSRQVSDICVTFYHCYAGRPVCSDAGCHTTQCYSLGGAYNPLNYGDSYGGGGSDSGTAGGGSSGGGSGDNGPWYLMNPDIDIYAYNSKIRSVFKNLTDYDIVLQREQLDYLKNNITILNDLTLLLVNNSREKSEFTNNVISALNDGAINSYKDFTTILEDFKISLKSPFNIDRFAINSATPEGAKFNSIYTSLTNSPMFAKLFLSLFGGPQQKFNVKFEIDEHVYEDNDPTKKEVNATTSQDPFTNNIIIKINKQILIAGVAKSQNNIENAKTILHECIHAYLFIKANNPTAGTDFVKILNTMYPTVNEQHDFMYDKMIPTMQIVLSEIRDLVTTVRGRIEAEKRTMHPTIVPLTSTPWNWNEYYKYISLKGLDEANCFKVDFPQETDQWNLFTSYIKYGHDDLQP